MFIRPLAYLAVLFLCACAGKPYAVPAAGVPTEPRNVQAFVVSHGWHTGLVIPGAVLNRHIPALESRFGTPAYYEVGWGDKGFYQAQEITTGLSLRAMFWSSGAVLHAVAIADTPGRSFPNSEIAPLCLSAEQVESVARFLSDSFARDPSGSVLPLTKGIYGDSQFYDGVGRYAMLNTCNVWTAKGLSSAGLDISPGTKLTAGSVMGYVANARPARLCSAVVKP